MGVPEELTPFRIGLLVLYATARTERATTLSWRQRARDRAMIRSRLGVVRGYGKSAVSFADRDLVEVRNGVRRHREGKRGNQEMDKDSYRTSASDLCTLGEAERASSYHAGRGPTREPGRPP
jgi:hypothetical protein